MKTVNLHTRLLLATIIPVTLFVSFFSVLIILFRWQDVDYLQQQTAEIMANKYEHLLSIHDKARWPETLQHAIEEKYVLNIAIFNQQRQVILNQGPYPHLAVNQLPTKAYVYSEARDEGLLIQTITPYYNQIDQQPYWLVIELRPTPFTLARYKSTIYICITAFMMLFLLSLLLAANLRRWLSPIQRMSSHLQQLTVENLDKPAKTNAAGDLAILEDHLNHLLGRVAHSYAELRQDIEQTRADLEEYSQTVEAQNIELRLSRTEAIEGNRIKSAFLANISHELRTPLNSINGFSRLLLKTPLQAKQTDFVETIQKSAENLLAIINDVLDFSKIEAGKLQLDRQPFSIEDAVFDVLNMLSPQADDKGLEQIAFIYDDVPPVVIGDALRLKQVLTNLVSNAIKFTKQGEVVVRVMLDETRHTYHILKISVSDTGIGLSRTAKADLFQAFQQGDPSVSRQYGGTGLGLVIAKNLVELMDGEMSFDEEQEHGATFWFTFRVGIMSEQADTPIRLRQKHVLVLEPQLRCLQLLRATLHRAEAVMTAVNDWDSLLLSLTDDMQAIVIAGSCLEQEHREHLQILRNNYQGLIIILSRGCDNHLQSEEIDHYRLRLLAKPVRPRQLLMLMAQGFSIARAQHIPSTTKELLPPNSTQQESNLHIMAVDDNPSNLKLVCTLLTDLGIRVTAASNGLEAVQLAAMYDFNLVFMDIQMPEMSGLEATKRIRAQEADNKHVPIIALTAHALADEREQMLKEGMNDYLTKPLQEEQLLHIIQHWTGVDLSNHLPHSPVMNSNIWQSGNNTLIDWDECLRLAAGKVDLAKDMLDGLLNSIPPQQEKLTRSWQQQNWPALLAHTHYLHGATRYCGVPALRSAVQALESALKQELHDNSNHDVCLEHLEPLFVEMMRTCESLLTWQEEQAQTTKAGG